MRAAVVPRVGSVKPNEKKAPNMYVQDVMKRQLYTSGVVQAVKATRKGFPDHLMFGECAHAQRPLERRTKHVLHGKAGSSEHRCRLCGSRCCGRRRDRIGRACL
jgi:hypothetical protein